LLFGFRLITYFVQNVAFQTQDMIFRLLWTKLPIYLNQLIFRKTTSLDIQYFEDSEFKNLLEKVKDSYVFRPQNFVQYLFFGYQSLVQVIIALIAIANLNWVLMLIVTLVSIPEFINQTKHVQLAWG